MRILMVGDIVGRPGRRAVQRLVPLIRKAQGIDFVVANAENVAGGIGATPETLAEVFDAGVDVVTLGNHVWQKREIIPYLEKDGMRVLRPANYPAGAPGTGWGVFHAGDWRKGVALGVTTLCGRVFMEALDSPFTVGEEVVRTLRAETPVIIVDFHAEATAEKMAFGRAMDGKVSAVLGTHTHIQTADEQILPGGTAYITDVGMTGPIDSVIGMNKQTIIQRFYSCVPAKFEVAPGPARLCGVVVEIEEVSGRATAISRVCLDE